MRLYDSREFSQPPRPSCEFVQNLLKAGSIRWSSYHDSMRMQREAKYGEESQHAMLPIPEVPRCLFGSATIIIVIHNLR